MKMQMRNDIKEARERAKRITNLAYDMNKVITEEDANFLYNVQVKAYLKGYKDALKNAETEAKDE